MQTYYGIKKTSTLQRVQIVFESAEKSALATMRMISTVIMRHLHSTHSSLPGVQIAGTKRKEGT